RLGPALQGLAENPERKIARPHQPTRHRRMSNHNLSCKLATARLARSSALREGVSRARRSKVFPPVRRSRDVVEPQCDRVLIAPLLLPLLSSASKKEPACNCTNALPGIFRLRQPAS